MDFGFVLDLAGRFGLDVVSLLVMAGILYRRRSSAPEMPLVFTALNLGLFAAVTVIGAHDVPTRIGFGLFALLSLVRLRSAAFTLQDIAYTFVALVLGLANGLAAAPLPLIVAIDVVLLLALAVADESRGGPRTHVMRLTLNRAVLDPAQIRQEFADQLPASVVAVAIDAVDHVRGTTRISVRHELDADNDVERMLTVDDLPQRGDS